MDISGIVAALHAERSWRQIAEGTGIPSSSVQRFAGGAIPLRPDDVDTKLRAYARREGIALTAPGPPAADGLAGPRSDPVQETRDEAERRKAVAQADLAELQAAERAGEVVPAARVQEAVHQAGVVARWVFDTLLRELHSAVTEKDVMRAIVERARTDLLAGQGRAFDA